ncbi:family 10 glycosylhydrolase [Pleurocapsa sp. PCC 7319]|uniref:family 10 glycosylhydrolase n=1 Tax=Pleurocapsa sp. PCC 7319 TaxID=118161 RepID=UPI000347DF2A|nr:family 10 glycosylhydrolase [Pleurocapsa sp. PCC 7319]
MSSQDNKPKGCGCGCANIPFSVILLLLGGGYWWFSKNGLPDFDLNRLNSFLAKIPGIEISIPISEPVPPPVPPQPTPTLPSSPIVSSPSIPNSSLNSSPNLPSSPIVNSPQPKPSQNTTKKSNQQLEQVKSQNQKPESKISPTINNWDQKVIRGIYLSRYQITNNASEQVIRDRVKFYRAQGINTIIHGVWGNACTMYNSQVMEQKLGYKSCPNKFRDRWLDWLIDEAHQQGIEVHAYFEKGIKIDQNSPVFDRAIAQKWIIPGIDRTYSGVEHYLLDVENPEVADFFRDILTEFVQKYPEIDAVQWDDYLGYHAELPGNVDRTESLTKFVQKMIEAMKQANPKVSFDICHHNPYWAKRYFAADWKKWDVDRIFIQNYNEKNFQAELDYVKQYDGIALTDQQFHRLPEIIDDNAIKSVLIFPLSGKPEQTAANLRSLTQEKNN